MQKLAKLQPFGISATNENRVEPRLANHSVTCTYGVHRLVLQSDIPFWSPRAAARKNRCRNQGFSNSGTDLSDSGTDHGCKPMQPRASLLLPTNACPWQPWVKLMLGQSQMHTGCSKTTQEPSKCMQIAPNVVTLFTIGKV